MEPHTKAAIAAIEGVEARVFPGAGEWRFAIHGRVARRRDGPSIDALGLEDLADRLVRRAIPSDVETLTAASNTAAVVVGKFTTVDRLKARGYLLVGASPVTLKIWRSGDDEASLGARERLVRRDLSDMPEFPAPPMLDGGRIGGIDYVVEPIIYGRHPTSASARLDAALELAPALARSWRAWGPVDQPLKTVIEPRFAWRLSRRLADRTIAWNPAWGSRNRVISRLLWLIQRNRHLPCAPVHGDLVTTNIIRQPNGRHLLVDWEHSRQMPIAFDLTKLLLSSGQPRKVNRRLAHEFRPFGEGRARYTWEEQVVLALARMLSWSPRSAAEVGRMEQFRQNRAIRLELMVELLGESSR